MYAQSLQPYLTLCDPTDCSQLGSYIHAISQARILESVAISLSRESSQPKNSAQVFCISGTARGFFTTESLASQVLSHCSPVFCSMCYCQELKLISSCRYLYFLISFLSSASISGSFLSKNYLISKFVWVVNLVNICMIFLFLFFLILLSVELTFVGNRILGSLTVL